MDEGIRIELKHETGKGAATRRLFFLRPPTLTAVDLPTSPAVGISKAEGLLKAD